MPAEMLIRDLIDTFISWNSRHRAPATVAFYRARLKRFCAAYNSRELGTLTALEIDEHLAAAGTGMSESTQHHNAVAVERLQKFALEHKLLERPVFGILEKSRVGRRERLPTKEETEAILAHSSPQFRLIYSALRQQNVFWDCLILAAASTFRAFTGSTDVLSHHKCPATGCIKVQAVLHITFRVVSSVRGRSVPPPV